MAEKKARHVTPTQKHRLIEYITNHPEMNSSKLSTSFTRENCRKMWLELANILNSIPTGPAKSADEWRKTWNDLKKNTKKKVSMINVHRARTGGGPALEGDFNDEDAQILTILKPTQILGDPEIVESQVVFEWDVQNVEDTTSATIMHKDTALTEKNIVDDKGSGQEATTSQTYEHDYYTLKNMSENIEEKYPKKKTKKQGRLDESISNSSKLLNLMEQKSNIIENYYNQKTRYLESKIEYQKEKLILYEQLVSTLREISKK